MKPGVGDSAEPAEPLDRGTVLLRNHIKPTSEHDDADENDDDECKIGRALV